jgi:ribosome-binding protein aMBF1 (putative translation factor)
MGAETNRLDHNRRVQDVESPLRRIRRQKGWSQEAVQRRVPGVSLSSIRAFDRGTSVPHATAVKKIARALGVPTDDLIPDEEPTECNNKEANV